tara:strand:+ start:2770 stop:3435 length:666 start_codon:yes stop_codon:yes gene_type:complete
MRLSVAIICACLVATPAAAGAWLRDKGSGFTATKSTLTDHLLIKNSFYFEYGLTAKTTVGLDVDTTATAFGQIGSGQIFVRRPLSFGGDRSVWAYQVGVGADFNGIAVTPLARLGLSYGRGLKLGRYDGWMGVDTALQWNFGTALRTVKVDTVAGLNFSDRSTAFVQMFWTGTNAGGSSTTLSTSYVHTPKRGKFSYLVGVETTPSDPTGYGIKLGFWHKF